MNAFVRWAVVASSLIVAVSAGNAQSDSQQTPQGGYTLHANAREVVTDVTVTDSKGNPIHGLTESAFHIFDNGKPQHVGTFEEHTGQEPTTPLSEAAGDVYSNAVVLHPPRVFNIILLDTITMNPLDQMYLRQELDHFIQALPPDQPFAIFARNSEHTVMLANFTADHKKLLDAVHYELPRLLPPGYRDYTEIPLLEEICSYLEQYPGRKNVLWFNGGSALELLADPTTFTGQVDLRPLYDELELARVALYPIDARGLVAGKSSSLASQDLLMEDEANATGGHAFFNTNGIALAAKHIADSDSSFYTVTYSPQDVKLDNRWHKVKVEVDGGHYQLSYRRGYFDDGSNLKHAEGPGRNRLLQNGETVPEVHAEPIVFQVGIKPAATGEPHATLQASSSPPRKGERAYSLHYSVPMDAITVHTVGGRDQISLGLALLAFNQSGRPVARITEKVTLGVSRERIDASGPSPRIGFTQDINLPQGEDFLYVGVWNIETGRMGTVQIPFAVKK
jgi:VWFA-related protein